MSSTDPKIEAALPHEVPKDYRPSLNVTANLPKPNAYVLALENEFKDYAFSEERALHNKGKWRSDIFKVSETHPMDLEIGTGNGNHFAHYVQTHPERSLIGLELKYKPLIQTIRRALDANCKNARIARIPGQSIDTIFNEGELDNVYIHFPDPWVTPKKPSKRLVTRHFLSRLWKIQKPGSFIEFKTDSREYFLWALNEIEASQYVTLEKSLNLHQSPYAEKNFLTTFERIFMKQGIEINYIKLQKPL
jgi:tRNA (guanine-N7-)-methyltransferase